MVRKKVLVLVGVAFDIKLFSHFHVSYMEYSRGQILKAHKSYKIVLSYAHVIVFYCTLEIKNLLWNFSLKWFLTEGCLKLSFQPDRFLNLGSYMWGFTVFHIRGGKGGSSSRFTGNKIVFSQFMEI